MNYDLQRFLDAQALMYQQALKEVEAGKKEDHWIWFIFPQLKGLGKSTSSRYFGITGIDEARAYYEHPVLGNRLREVTAALLMNDKSADEILVMWTKMVGDSDKSGWWLSFFNSPF